MSDRRTEWLATLATGQPVLVERGAHGIERATVDRMTATQIVVGSQRFRRSDGGLMGSSSYWSSRLCEPKGPQLDKALRIEFIRALGEASRNPSILTTDELKQIAGIIRVAKRREAEQRKDA